MYFVESHRAQRNPSLRYMAFLWAFVRFADNMVGPPFVLRFSCRARTLHRRQSRPPVSRKGAGAARLALTRWYNGRARRESPRSCGPWPQAIPYVTEPKYIHTELGIGYRMLED